MTKTPPPPSAYDQSAVCLWCLEPITRAVKSGSPWKAQGLYVSSCGHRRDGLSTHQPLEPGEVPPNICRCEADVNSRGYIDPSGSRCTVHTGPWKYR